MTDAQLKYNGEIQRAAWAANIFCPKCLYVSNGVLDEFCGQENCPEAEFEKKYRLEHPFVETDHD